MSPSSFGSDPKVVFDLAKIQEGIPEKISPSYAGRRSGGGSKIQKTNRIRVNVGATTTIYCAYNVIQTARPFLIQMHQVYAPKKGAASALAAVLKHLADTKPQWFPASSLDIINKMVIRP